MALFTGALLLDLLGICTALAAVLYAYFKWRYQYWERRGVATLEPSIPYGNFVNPMKRNISVGDELIGIYKQMKAKGVKHGGLYNTLSTDWLVLDLDLVKHVLTKDFQHFVDRGTYTNEKDDPLSCHLFALGGVKWRNLRAKVSPTFTSGKMKSMFQTVIDCGLGLEKFVKEEIGTGQPVDIKNVLGCFSTDVIGSCAFGLDCNSFRDRDSKFRKYGKNIFERSRYLGIIRSTICTHFPDFARACGLRMTNKEASDFFMKVVEDTVNYRQNNNVVRKDFLQLLINIKADKDAENNGHKGDGTSLTMDEIAAQSLVFFLAGFETSSTTMTFALYELATHQELQDKVREEITTVLAKHDNKITYDSLNELKYMGQVIDETLRKYPPLPLVTRQCIQDYKVPGEDLIIEKGTKVIIPILGIQRDEEYYKDPEVFDPERFNEENKSRIPRYANIPFGEGPRICIGERFGIMQTKVGMTCILRNFKVRVDKKTKLPLIMAPRSFVLAGDGEIWLSLENL